MREVTARNLKLFKNMYILLLQMFILLHCSYSFPKAIIIPSYHHSPYHLEQYSFQQYSQKRKHFTIFFSSQFTSSLSSTSSSFSPSQDQCHEQFQENDNNNVHITQGKDNTEHLHIPQGASYILENQLQLLTAVTKSITAELHLFFEDAGSQEPHKLIRFLSHSPPDIEIDPIKSEENLHNLLATAPNADTMIIKGKCLVIPVQNKECQFGYLYLQRGKNQKKGLRSSIWKKDVTALNYAQNTAESFTHILNMEGGGFPEATPSYYVPSTISNYEMNKILMSFYPRLQEAKVELKFIRTFTKNLQKRISNNDEMGKEMAENIFVQVEALEENVEGMEASLASIPEPIDESTYSDQSHPLLPMPNDETLHEEGDDKEKDILMEREGKVLVYQMHQAEN